MMKRVLCILALLSLLFTSAVSLTSCHGRDAMPEFVMPESFDESEKQEITFWAKNDNNKRQQQIYRDTVARFEALYPNIDVTMRLFSDYNEIYKQVITNISTNTTPNICITYPDHIATYNQGDNIIVPLDALMSDAEWGLGSDKLKFDAPTAEEIVPKFLDEGKINGTQYALPFMRSTEACYVNVDLVKALGFELPEKLTWDFVWQVSEAATEKNPDGTFKANGQDVLYPFIYKSTDNMMIQLLKQHGAEYSNDDGDILIFNDTTESILNEVAGHAESGAFNIFAVVSYPGDYLNRGQCIFAIDSTAGATWMGHDAPNLDVKVDELVEFEMAVKEIPQVNPSEPAMISQGPSICIFNKEDASEVMASWIFSQFLLTNEVQIDYSTTEGYAPVTTKAHEAPEFIDYLSRAGEEHAEKYYQRAKIDATKIILDNLDCTFVTPVFNGSTSLRNAAGYLIENTVRSVHRGKTVDESFIDDLIFDTSKLYRLDQVASGPQRNDDLGEIQPEAILLIVSMVVVWLGIGAYFIIVKIKERKKT